MNAEGGCGCLLPLGFEENSHRTATDFAVVVDFRGGFRRMGERNLEFLETGWAGHGVGFHWGKGYRNYAFISTFGSIVQGAKNR